MAKVLELAGIQTVKNPDIKNGFCGAFSVGIEKLKEYEARRRMEDEQLRNVKLRF